MTSALFNNENSLAQLNLSVIFPSLSEEDRKIFAQLIGRKMYEGSSYGICRPWEIKSVTYSYEEQAYTVLIRISPLYEGNATIPRKDFLELKRKIMTEKKNFKKPKTRRLAFGVSSLTSGIVAGSAYANWRGIAGFWN